MRYFIEFAYDGKAYHGWQRQPDARSVQQTMEEAMSTLWRSDIQLVGAGRTDAGVHATGQVAGFEIAWNHSNENLRDALNANLPEDVVIRTVEQAGDDFHPRYSATARCYQYKLFFDQTRDPIKERFAWRIPSPLAMDAVEIAAEKIVGKHNFSAFGTPHQTGGSTIREIFSTSWQIENEHLVFEILGNAFLYHMVRRLVSFLIEIGKGQQTPESLDELLAEEQETMVQGLAPAKGLFLKEVRYPD